MTESREGRRREEKQLGVKIQSKMEVQQRVEAKL